MKRSRSSISVKPGKGDILKKITDYKEQYDVGAPFGSNPDVVVATHQENEVEYVSRSIKKADMPVKDPSMIEDHLITLRGVEHINICRFIQGFDDKDRSIVLMYEKAQPTSLFEELGGVEKPEDEQQVQQYARQIAMAFHVAHRQGIVHGRFKESSLLVSPIEQGEDDARLVKICDMGQTFILRPQSLDTTMSKIEYAPPEVLWGEVEAPSSLTKYKKLTKDFATLDMWALGIILYRLLTGTMPFSSKGKQKEGLVEEVKTHTVMFTKAWDKMPDAREVVHGLLIHANRLRMTAEKMLRHPWIAKDREKMTRGKMMRVLRNVLYNTQESTFKKFAIRVIAEDMPPETLEIVEAAFRSIDKNGDGTLEIVEIQDALRKFMSEDDSAVSDEIFATIDRDASGTINFAEFTAVSIGPHEYCDKETLWHIFNRFDKDHNGTFEHNEIATVVREVEALAEGTRVDKEVEEIAKDIQMPMDFDSFVHIMYTPTGQPVSQLQCVWGRILWKVLKFDVHGVRNLEPKQYEGAGRTANNLMRSPYRRSTITGADGAKKSSKGRG